MHNRALQKKSSDTILRNLILISIGEIVKRKWWILVHMERRKRESKTH